MYRCVTFSVLVIFCLSGCAYDVGTDDYIGDYEWRPPSFGYSFGATHRSPAYRYGNPFYGCASNYDPYYYCPPGLSSLYGYRGLGYYGRVYYDDEYYLGYGRVNPDKQLKRERKQQRKALKRQRKAEKKTRKQERKFEKRHLKQHRKLAKRQIKQQRKQVKRQRKQEKRERKRQARLNR